MKIEVELTDYEAGLVHTCIRRSIYEQYYRNIAEPRDTEEEAAERTEATVDCFFRIKKAIEKARGKEAGKNGNNSNN